MHTYNISTCTYIMHTHMHIIHTYIYLRVHINTWLYIVFAWNTNRIKIHLVVFHYLVSPLSSLTDLIILFGFFKEYWYTFKFKNILEKIHLEKCPSSLLFSPPNLSFLFSISWVSLNDKQICFYIPFFLHKD